MLSLRLRRPKKEKTNKQRQFIGIVNYHRNMWFRRSDILVWIHWLASHQARSSLNGTHPINRPLIKLRKSFRSEVFLCYPDFNKPVLFHLYTDASDHQLGAVIMQDRKPHDHSLLFAKAEYRSKSVYNHWKQHRVVIIYWNLKGIQEYAVSLPLTHYILNWPSEQYLQWFKSFRSRFALAFTPWIIWSNIW
jgi:hypothetical protein